jgi:hypothetical protein
VAFTAPAFAGLPAVITSFTVTSSPGGITASGASSPVAITGLTEGTPYTFTVTATNASGTGTASAASNSVTPMQINYIEEVFSTWLYTGNGSTQTITNGIDLAGKGGMVWVKSRSNAYNNTVIDTVRGMTYSNYRPLFTNLTSAQSGPFSDIMQANADGFSYGTSGTGTAINSNGATYVSWTFREQPKFFDVVTWSGNSTARSIAHNLGSVPGCIIVKILSASGENWVVWHRSINQDSKTQLFLNTTDAAVVGGKLLWGASGTNANMTSTTFSVGTATETNETGQTYVAYVFAHNSGGFGLTGTDNVISCGSFTTDGSGRATVNLGYEPQWVMMKNSQGAEGWWMTDTMRGSSLTSYGYLFANASDAEAAGSGTYVMAPTATGFLAQNLNTSATYIYIAIRRPMKVPTTGASVFSTGLATTNIQDGTQLPSAGFPVDLQIGDWRNGNYGAYATDRLRGGAYSYTFSTGAEGSSLFAFDSMTNVRGKGNFESSSNPFVFWQFRRAPGFFDEVCYTGTGSATTVAHNLTVVPELIITKRRNGSTNWIVYSAALGNEYGLILNEPEPLVGPVSIFWNSTTPTSSVFSLGTSTNVNSSANTFVAYLFATCPGVSKVGSYTGTGTTQVINCGFTAGSRFVLIKRTDSTGDWYVWDSARGIIAGNDPYLLLNSTAAEVTNTDYVDTAATGFEISSTAPAAINASGGTFIFLAIA